MSSSHFKRVLYFFVFASLVSLAYFGPYLKNYFVYDDYFFLERIIQVPQRLFIGYNDNLRIISNSVWLPLYFLFELDPFGYNLFSLTLYIFNAVVLYWLLELLFANNRLAFLAAGFFVAGSVGADAVFWRGASSTLLNVSFYLLALCAYVLFRQRKENRYWHLSIGIFALAIFSKEEAASIPFIIAIIELLIFKGHVDAKATLKRITPYCLIIVLYICLNYLIIYQLLHSKSFMSGVATFRPMYSLFAGWSVFFLAPQSILSLSNPMIYLTGAFITLSFFFVTDRRPLLFAYLWIFFTFLPQSLSGQSQFSTTMLINSISRHLYLPSIGSSLVMAILLVSIHDRWPARRGVLILILCFASYIVFNYSRVHERGESWAYAGESMAIFIKNMQRVLPSLQENTCFCTDKSPEGRSFMQAAVRTAYKNPDILWLGNAENSQLPPQCSIGILLEFNRDDAARPVTVISSVMPK
jgi:hypothetical protein